MDTIVGGRIQDTLDADETGFGLEIYANHRRHYLYLSADPTTPRIHLVEDKLRRGLPRPTQLGLLLRRYVEGGYITHLYQPEWERIIRIEIEGAEGPFEIIVEPMERRSNILLVQGGVIMDCVRRVGPKENRRRLSLPSHQYVPPPPQIGKRNPLTITGADMTGFFEQATDAKLKAFQTLTGHLLGISPLLAQEIIFRAEGDPIRKASEISPENVLGALRALLEPLAKRQWQPGIAEEEGLVTAFSVYPLQCRSGWHPVATISRALVAYYGAPVGEDAYTAAKIPAQKAIEEARKKTQAKLASLAEALVDDTERERLRQSGELILAYQYTLKAKQTELRAQYEVDGPELVITLDPALSPLDNAQRYFDRYNRAKRALEDVPQLIKATKIELAYLAQLETDLMLATNWPEIDEVQQALHAGGYWSGGRAKRLGSGLSAPIRIVTKDGFVILVGRNSRQNEIVTFKKANGEDFWLHVRNAPGAHVIVKFDGRHIPETIIEQAAALAAYYSARRNDGKVSVDVTRCKHVKKIKGAGPGMVTYRNEQTRVVEPRSEKTFEE